MHGNLYNIEEQERVTEHISRHESLIERVSDGMAEGKMNGRRPRLQYIQSEEDMNSEAENRVDF